MNDHEERLRFQQAIDRRLSGLTENPFLAQRVIEAGKGESQKMKRKLSASIVLAAVLICMFIVSGAAAAKLGVLNLFSYGDQLNESAAGGVQRVAASAKGSVIRYTVDEALYDNAGKNFALSFTIENLTNEENLYVLCESISFGGEQAHLRSMNNITEFILPQGTTEGAVLGELPEGESSKCEMIVTFLRPLYPYVDMPYETDDTRAAAAQIRESGGIPVEGDGMIFLEEMYEMGYVPAFSASGLFEIADRFTLSFNLEPGLLDDTKREYSGPDRFTFDDYELQVLSAYTTATAAYFRIAYITSEPPMDLGKGFGPAWQLAFDVPGSDAWTGNAGGSWEDPVQLEDGRYMSVYNYEALDLFTQPDTIQMLLVTYDETYTPTVHEKDAVLLSF